MFRHGRKDGENIADDQINELMENGIPSLNPLLSGIYVALHEGSAFSRTKQTLNALEWYMDTSITYTLDTFLESDPRFGNEEMFAKFLTNDLIKAEAKGSNWFAAFSKHNPNFITEVQKGMIDAIKDAFEQVEEDTTILICGHTPCIEWLAFALDKENKISRNIQLKELTGFIFTDENGVISVTGTIGF